MDPEKLHPLLDRIIKEEGRSITKTDVKNALEDQQWLAMEEKGIAHIGVKKEACDCTAVNYAIYLATKGEVSFAQSVTRKTSTRYTAEMSLISAMVYCATVAATHYLMGKRDDYFMEKIRNISVKVPLKCCQ